MRLHDGKIGCLSEYTIQDLAKRLADYEDAEENGMLKRFPCRSRWESDCMDIKEYAEMLNGKEYGYSMFSKEELQIAKDNGFVIVYGASDDLMEFDGSLYEEAGCYDGGNVYFDKTGAVTDEEFSGSRCIEAVWCDKERTDENGNVIAWTYKTDIPHETFMIYEDGEPYCEAIVFDVRELD